jgi:alpha-L-fucosidase
MNEGFPNGRGASFGIFIHWGPYSVPAWAEVANTFGTEPEGGWFKHNSYAEWYAKTIRIEGAPAAAQHAEVYGSAPYEDFLDQWRAEAYDPAAWAKLFREFGADYVIPVTEHHDGVTLWDAPGNGGFTTVDRGPKRDLLGPPAAAVRAEGMRLGESYSGGLKWRRSPTSAPRGRRCTAQGYEIIPIALPARYRLWEAAEFGNLTAPLGLDSSRASAEKPR